MMGTDLLDSENVRVSQNAFVVGSDDYEIMNRDA
jgi:hypothetical protein